MPSVIHGYCALWRSRGGVLCTVVICGTRSLPSGKAECMKGQAAPESVHSPHRVFYP
jgi:hypothetical protein